MKDITTWLEAEVERMMTDPNFSEDATEFSIVAEGLKLRAEDEGFTIEELHDACDGDVARYLMDRQNAFTSTEMDQSSEDHGKPE